MRKARRRGVLDSSPSWRQEGARVARTYTSVQIHQHTPRLQMSPRCRPGLEHRLAAKRAFGLVSQTLRPVQDRAWKSIQ